MGECHAPLVREGDKFEFAFPPKLSGHGDTFTREEVRQIRDFFNWFANFLLPVLHPDGHYRKFLFHGDPLEITVGCGLEIVAGVIHVDNADLAGEGLVEAGAGCALDVNVGCGLTVAEGAVAVDNADLAGNGLVAGDGCALDVNVGCGLELAAGAVAVKASDLAGAGLEAGEGCALNVDCAYIVAECLSIVQQEVVTDVTCIEGVLTVTKETICVIESCGE